MNIFSFRSTTMIL